MAQTRRVYVNVQCDPPLGQLCKPPKKILIDTGSELTICFTVFKTHCAPIILHIYLDGPEVNKTRLGYVNERNQVIGSLTTGFLKLGPVIPAKHELILQAEGEEEGCNHGELYSWGGYLEIIT